MAQNESYVMTSHNLLNYSGLLFAKGNASTPFSTLIGGKSRRSNSWLFPTSLEYNIQGGESQPAISETASLTAPNPTFRTRSQNKNACQIFQGTLQISYGKQSSMGQLSGLNIAGQTANPQNELDFQVGVKMKEMAKDIEYTLVNGVFQDGDYDDVAYKTCGIVNAIQSITADAEGDGLGFWQVALLLKDLSGEAPVDNLVLMLRGENLLQLNADALKNGMTVIPASREINGIKIDTLITPFGTIGLLLNNFLPAGTAVIVNPTICAPVYMDVPGKGNFFLEPLAKVGASDKYQIYGQLGLDYGAEWYHGKITNLKTTFDRPDNSIKISGAVATIATDATILGATLDKNTVEASDTAKVAVASVQYNVTPAEAPTVAYLWQVRAKTGTVWTDLTSAYTGYNTAELTVKAADAEKHYRCKVTASGSATGTVYSDECDVASA
jgi:hypothetical protein